MTTFDPITAALAMGKLAIERIWPDPTQRAEQLYKLEQLGQQGNLAELNAHVQMMTMQMEINKVEAQHGSLFVAGPRPFILWVGGFSLAWAGLIHPLLMWVWAFAGVAGDPPPMIESGALTVITSALLGVGGMRSFDKTKGAHSKGIS